MYKVGDYIVKPVNGVCQVKDLVHLDFSDSKQKKQYYLLIPVEDGSGKIYMPTAAQNNAVRPVMTKEEAKAFICRIPEVDEPWIDNEKNREKYYRDAIRSNNPERLVGIIKLIHERRQKRQEQGKKVTVVDERYFKEAENLLYSELEVVLEKDKEEIYDIIKKQCETAK